MNKVSHLGEIITQTWLAPEWSAIYQSTPPHGWTFYEIMAVFSPMPLSEIFELFPNFMRKSQHFGYLCI